MTLCNRRTSAWDRINLIVNSFCFCNNQLFKHANVQRTSMVPVASMTEKGMRRCRRVTAG